MNIYSVSPKTKINDGGMHQWYIKFGQQCSISVVNFKIKARLYHPLGEHCIYMHT